MRGAPRGFTLIELMVAITIGGTALALVAGSVWATVQTRERQLRVSEEGQRFRVTRDLLREVVRGMAAERTGRAELLVLEDGRSRGGAPADRLVVASRGGAVLGWDAELKAVELLLDDDPLTPQSGLVARVLRRAGTDAAVEDTVELLPAAARFSVRLLGADGDWRDEWPETALLPAAVEFRFDAGRAAPPGEELPLVVRVP